MLLQQHVRVLPEEYQKIGFLWRRLQENRIRIQRHAVETNSYVSTRLRLEEFPVETWRISLSLSPEGDDGSVLFCVPACSPVAVRGFKRNVTCELLLIPRKPPSCWHDVHLYGHSW